MSASLSWSANSTPLFHEVSFSLLSHKSRLTAAFVHFVSYTVNQSQGAFVFPTCR